ncbi:uncharacterized membrane-anchored protein YjiN (DUF445 family) [Kineococcus radiotolerans]|uniref:Uncharacterized membrane-anchored protein YjiN (DUF445 family) n=1 Tax=Kineococcus radiotolerans TaxID=131568 RepID=A0A7W4TJD4_KINRA|nr:DUF445 domain-containing protein [Kineococcus radiotolerans]MBB2900009.1 uncharacterized membrane-anchored protein YjiN (DUF445 family) [Kineococcus radiotolerans]
MSTPRPPALAGLGDTIGDDERRAALRRMRLLATGLLVLAAVVYALTLGSAGAWGFVNAAAEAAMVGAVADWFAVTAIFRHPLRLPIPHTALIPRRKEALGKSLEQFVAENFLAEDVVRDKVVRAGIPRRAGSWLADRGGSARVVEEASTILTGAMGILRDEEVTAVLDQVLVRRLGSQSWSPVLGRLLGEVVADGTHHPVVDLTLAEAQRWLRTNEDRVRAMVTGRAPLWVPDWLNDRLGKRVYDEARSWVDEVAADRDSAGRKAIDDLLARYADALQHDPETRAKADEFQQRLLNSPGLADTVAGLWASVRRFLLEALADPASSLRVRSEEALVDVGNRLVTDEVFAERVEGHLTDAAGHVVRRFAPELATVISDTVARWDGDDAARRIELHVGRDLQFIRINGTVVGGLVGVLIHTVTVLVS